MMSTVQKITGAYIWVEFCAFITGFIQGHLIVTDGTQEGIILGGKLQTCVAERSFITTVADNKIPAITAIGAPLTSLN